MSQIDRHHLTFGSAKLYSKSENGGFGLSVGVSGRGPNKNVDTRLPGKGDSNSHSARPVNQNHLDEKVDSEQ